MSKTIRVSQEVYDYLSWKLKKRETIDDTLRRLLRMDKRDKPAVAKEAIG